MIDKPQKFIKNYQEGGTSQASQVARNYIQSRLRMPIRKTTRSIVQRPSIFAHSQLSRQLNVFNEQWDLLIILDACRVDALKDVANEYDFIPEVNKRWSVGASSPEWIVNTFDRRFIDKIAKTAYITSNPHALSVINNQLEQNHKKESQKVHRLLSRYGVTNPTKPDEFHTYIPLYDISITYGSVRFPSPRSVTDHAIRLDRNHDPDRIILHYMPPHYPHLAKMNDGEIKLLDEPRPKTDYDAYLDNLRWGLNEIEILLDNVDRDRVVISSDHGENFWFRPIFRGHGAGKIDPTVRWVPWVKTEATDNETHQPDIDKENQETDTMEMLEALGYIS